jgi:hypothetical protein
LTENCRVGSASIKFKVNEGGVTPAEKILSFENNENILTIFENGSLGNARMIK